MCGSIYLEVMGLIHSALGGQSAPRLQVSHTMPGKSNHKNPHVMRCQGGWSTGTSYHSVAAIKLDWDFTQGWCLLPLYTLNNIIIITRGGGSSNHLSDL